MEPRGEELERGHGSEPVSGPGTGQAPPGTPEEAPPGAPVQPAATSLTCYFARPDRCCPMPPNGRKPWLDFIPLQRDRHASADAHPQTRPSIASRHRVRGWTGVAARPVHVPDAEGLAGHPPEPGPALRRAMRSLRSFVRAPVSHERGRSHPVVIVVHKVTPLAFEP